MKRSAIGSIVLTIVVASALAGCGSGAFGVASGQTRAVPAPAVDEPLAGAPAERSVVFAGGCFWGVQAVFQHVKGVKSAVSGYSGGAAATAHYERVSEGTTGHAESVEVTYDPSQVSFGQLLEVFFSVAHDPTERDRQGPDTGSQYRSAIFTTSDDQTRVAQAYIRQLDEAKVFSGPIVTELKPLAGFYPAEDYHQDYATLHPESGYIRRYDLPKVSSLEKQYPDLYRAK
jgi:peptide-methionine (S)-S-oxide reductase